MNDKPQWKPLSEWDGQFPILQVCLSMNDKYVLYFLDVEDGKPGRLGFFLSVQDLEVPTLHELKALKWQADLERAEAEVKKLQADADEIRQKLKNMEAAA